MKYWVIVNADDSIQQVMGDVKPSAAVGYANTITAKYVGEVPRFGNLQTESLNAGRTGWVTNLTVIKTNAIQKINDERELRQMAAMTPGGAKKFVYAQKSDEVRSYNLLGAAAFNALSTDEQNHRFPFVMKQKARTGQTVAQVIAEFDSGSQTSIQETARIESIARKTISDVKAASTEGAVNSALAALDWNWSG